jgi:tRNA (mo5U34)-methyltransferase
LVRALQFEQPPEQSDYVEHWYHTITFPDGEVTPGIYDHRELVPHYGLPDDLRGRRALDAGTANGFWAFEMERHGAEVVAVDVQSSVALDFPPQVLSALKTMPPRPRGQRFREAHARLGSQVRYIDRSVYAIDRNDLGQFDLVHAGDILLHLERPLEAVRRFREVVNIDGQLIISDVVDPDLPPREGAEFLTKYLGGWDTHTWWCPSVDALGQMIVDAGFTSVELHLLYMLTLADGTWGLGELCIALFHEFGRRQILFFERAKFGLRALKDRPPGRAQLPDTGCADGRAISPRPAVRQCVSRANGVETSSSDLA